MRSTSFELDKPTSRHFTEMAFPCPTIMIVSGIMPAQVLNL